MKNQSQTYARPGAMTKVLRFFEVLSWIIFIGLLVEAGSILFKVILTFTYTSMVSSNFLNKADLIPLLDTELAFYMGVVFFLFCISALKAFMFYKIVDLLSYKKFSLVNPFQAQLFTFLNSLAYLSLAIGVVIYVAAAYVNWLAHLDIDMPSLMDLNMVGHDVWLFLAAILFIVAQLVKKGVSLQEDLDLTI